MNIECSHKQMPYEASHKPYVLFEQEIINNNIADTDFTILQKSLKKCLYKVKDYIIVQLYKTIMHSEIINTDLFKYFTNTYISLF